MKLRNVVLAGAGTAVGLAAVNRRLRRQALAPPLDRDRSTDRWRGMDIAYTDAGDPSDPDLVLLHGINAAASSHEFCRVVDDLTDRYHVLAPDLPGFGHSDRPPLQYSATLYVSFIADFLHDVAEDPTVVASSLTGAYAAMAVHDHDLAVRDLLLVCPTAETLPGPRRLWLRELVRSPIVGEALFNLLASKSSIRYFLVDHGFETRDAITDEWVDYDYATAHQPGARYAPASFLSGYLDPDVDLASVLSDLEVPVTLLWGSESDFPPLEAGTELAERSGAALFVLEGADLLPHAEFPEEFRNILTEDVAAV